MFGTVALVSTLAGLAAAAPVALESNTVPEVYSNLNASFWYDGAYTGSCGYTNSTQQYIASIKKSAESSSESVCGKTVNITDSEQDTWVLAMVVDEAVNVPEHYLNISRVTFQELAELEEETLIVSYTFVDAAVPEWVEPKAAAAPVASPKKQASNSKPEGVAAPAPAAPSSSSSSSAKSAPTSSSKQAEQAHPAPAAPVTTSSSKKAEQAHYAPVTTSSSKKVEQQKQYAPPTTTSSSKKQVYTPKTTPEVKKPAYTPKTTSSKKAVETPKKPSTGSGGGQFSGRGTWFTQGGNAGACGNVNSDSAYIVALNSAQYAGGSHCGQSVRISVGGKSITARVADLCPGCPYGGLDLSTGAFQALGSLGQGVLPLSWSWA